MTKTTLETGYYVRTAISEKHSISEGPFATRSEAWSHEYANDQLDARRSDSRRGILERKDGRHSFICSASDLQMDLDNEQCCEEGRIYDIRPVTPVCFPELWERADATEQLESADRDD